MHRWITIAAVLFATLIMSESPTRAQMGGMGSGGMMSRPRRKLHKNNSPALSPQLNLLPGTATTFEGQFLMRQLPQEQMYKNADQTRKAVDGLQNQIDQQQNQIRTGIGKTGHRVMFMNYGGYYQYRGRR